jgi:cell division septal protein FtsQ
MTEQRRQPREQIASHIYRRPTTPAPRRRPPTEAGNAGTPLAGVRGVDASNGAGTSRGKAGNVRTPLVGVQGGGVRGTAQAEGRRVVTRPEVIQSVAGERYIDRRNQLYSARTRPPAHPKPRPRTLAQTGLPASSGQMRAIKRPLPRYHASPVPVRSGGNRGRRGGFLWKVLGMFALLAVFVLGASFAMTSPAFRVAQVSVMGTHNAILISSIQHLGMQGQNIFLIDVVALTARIDMLPVVASVNIEKQLPNQLLVTVTERAPVLLWQTKYGTYSVDKNGVVIAPASETTGADSLMTVVDTRSSAAARKGTTAPASAAIHPGVRLNEADISFAMAVFASLPKLTGITDFTLRYAANGPGNGSNDGSYQIESKTGWLAYLGGANDANPLGNRLLELQQILTLAQQQQLNLATIDLRFGLRPVYTLKP